MKYKEASSHKQNRRNKSGTPLEAKSVLLFSGGLDSILAAEILLVNKIDVLALTFKSPFFTIDNALLWSEKLGIPCRVVDFTADIISLVKKPRFSWGKNLNPCIDCHLTMIKRAGKIMQQEKFDFISTGEVLGERPFSQSKQALTLIDKHSGYGDKTLRPLSAKLLPPTIAEKFIAREKLYDFSGRGRQGQMQLAKEFNISTYPSPGGGCLLTESGFCQKLKSLMQHHPQCDGEDVELIKWGRHFYLEEGARLILGRNQTENNLLREKTRSGDLFFDSGDLPIPCAILRFKNPDHQVRDISSIKEAAQKKVISFAKDKNLESLICFVPTQKSKHAFPNS